jgi:hypothetical protein
MTALQRQQQRIQRQHQKTIRQLLQCPSNKTCADCGEQCTVNIDTTHAVFLCTTCSGIHREFGDRIKSICMSTFTQDEVRALESGTNEDVNRMYLARWRPGDLPPPLDGNNVVRRTYIEAKYRQRRWHSDHPAQSQPQGGALGDLLNIDQPSHQTKHHERQIRSDLLSLVGPAPALNSARQIGWGANQPIAQVGLQRGFGFL